MLEQAWAQAPRGRKAAAQNEVVSAFQPCPLSGGRANQTLTRHRGMLRSSSSLRDPKQTPLRRRGPPDAPIAGLSMRTPATEFCKRCFNASKYETESAELSCSLAPPEAMNPADNDEELDGVSSQ